MDRVDYRDTFGMVATTGPDERIVAHGSYARVDGDRAEVAFTIADPYQGRLRRTLGDASTDELLVNAPHEAFATLGEVLLTPTTIYARAVLAVRDAVELRGVAHITGGGLPGNVPRALPDGLAARLDPTRWRMPSVMRLFGALGGLGAAGPQGDPAAGIQDDDLRATFNGGIGMVLVVPPAAVPDVIRVSSERGVAASLVGEVVPAATTGGARYVEGPLETLA